MSEEVKLAANIANVYIERLALLDQLHAAERERNAAIERERIAVEAYNQQQSSYRELEALYQAMTERAQKAESNWGTEIVRAAQADLDAAALYEAMQDAIDCGCKGVHWVDIEGEPEAEACDLWIALDDRMQAFKNAEHPGAALLARIARAAPGRPGLAAAALSEVLAAQDER